MAEPKTEPQPASGSAAGLKPVPAPTPTPKAPPRNPALRMLGIPGLPKKLPSRNWMIFWTVSGAITAAIIYDRREKRRATAKWRRAVAPLAKELIPKADQLPRKLTIFLEAPPGDGLRVAQDHFVEYAKPVLATSGLDWEFIQGRQQGDVRAAVAEKIRRTRRQYERPDEPVSSTGESIVADVRKKNASPEWEGVQGDIVVGRHAWKEYIRGLHEGWLGPLDPPERSVVETKPVTELPLSSNDVTNEQPEDKKEEKQEEKQPEKRDRPPQPPPYNSIDDYGAAHLPAEIPAAFDPSALLPLPHRLGVSHTFVRLGRFFNRRQLADSIGHDVAAVCFAAARDWREADGQCEQQLIMQKEEDDWPRSVWKEDQPKEVKDVQEEPPKELIWTSPITVDERIVQRMRRFEMEPEEEARAAAIVVPEEEVEGWIKGSVRSMWRWGMTSWNKKPLTPNVGNLDDE